MLLARGFDYFLYNAVKGSLREPFTAYLIFAPIFSETLTASAFQKKLAQFSQKFRLTFDYFSFNAAKRPHRGRFAAYLILAPIFFKTLTQSAF
jgi:hypothetical protein